MMYDNWLPERSMNMQLIVQPLAAETFAPYGDVIGLPPKAPVDPGKSQRIPGVGTLNFQGGLPSLDLLYSALCPLQVAILERHRNSTQAFLPLAPTPFVVVVAPPGAGSEAGVDPEQLQAFISNGHEGVSFHAGVWHHPLLPVGAPLVSAIVHRSPEIDLDGQVAKLLGQQVIPIVL
jgi:ureidoglycolate lyase